jgi:hypothetical protein
MSGATPEFHRFVVLHLSEFPLVYDWSLPSTVEGASVATLLQQLTAAPRSSTFDRFHTRSLPWATRGG